MAQSVPLRCCRLLPLQGRSAGAEMVTRPEPCAAAAAPPALRSPASCRAEPGVQGTGLALFPAPGRDKTICLELLRLVPAPHPAPPPLFGGLKPSGSVRALTARAGMHECPLGTPRESESPPCALLPGAPGPRVGSSGSLPPPRASARTPSPPGAQPRTCAHPSPSPVLSLRIER